MGGIDKNMLRRIFSALGALVLLTCLGCQHFLTTDGSFQELTTHAERLDHEFYAFYSDANMLVFGLEEPPPPTPWKIYSE